MRQFAITTLLLSCLFTFSSFPAFAQRSAERLWKGNQLDAHLGIGLFSTFSADKARAAVPPLTISGEYLLNEKLSLGFQFGYTAAEKTRETLGQQATWHNDFYTFSLRTGFHYTRISRWDLYGGFALSHNISRISKLESEKSGLDANLGIQESTSQFSYTAFLGCRYAANQRVSLFAEAGFLTSIVTAGFGYRLL